MSELPLEPWASILVVFFGLTIGSFLNVCIHRMPIGASVVAPRSRCPKCETLIRWYDNVPVLSWILLRAKCRTCGTPISARYPFVELLAGLTTFAFWKFYGPGIEFGIASGFTLAMVALFFTDWDHQLLPDAITLTGFASGLALAWFNPFLDGSGLTWVWDPDPTGLERIWFSIQGAALGSGLLWGVGAVYGKLRGVEAMGMGDVKMMALVGAFSGPTGVLFTIFAGSLVGAVVGVALMPLRGRSMQDKLPFGCFLAPAALAALLVGRQAIRAYLDMVVFRG